MLLERRTKMFTHNPFIVGNKLYFFKEGLGFNPTYYSNKSGFTEGADHAYVQAGSGGSASTYINFSLPATLKISNVYLDGSVGSTASNYRVSLKNDSSTQAELIQYTGATWNNSTTSRTVHGLGYPTSRLKNGVARTFTLGSNFVQFRCYNMYVILA